MFQLEEVICYDEIRDNFTNECMFTTIIFDRVIWMEIHGPQFVDSDTWNMLLETDSEGLQVLRKWFSILGELQEKVKSSGTKAHPAKKSSLRFLRNLEEKSEKTWSKRDRAFYRNHMSLKYERTNSSEGTVPKNTADKTNLTQSIGLCVSTRWARRWRRPIRQNPRKLVDCGKNNGFNMQWLGATY